MSGSCWLFSLTAARMARKPKCETRKNPTIQTGTSANETGQSHDTVHIFSGLLVLLRHIFLGRDRLTIGVAQREHRGSVLTRALMRRRRIVAIEFGTWRSGRSGGSAGSVTVGCAKFLEHPSGTRC